MNVPFAELLSDAVNKPGILSDCYKRFYNYSFGNQMWIWSQLVSQDKPLQPVNTFDRWLKMGRCVSKGQKAMLSVLIPMTIGKKEPEDKGFTMFKLRNCLFTVDQTTVIDAEKDIETAEITAEWDKALALETLNISEAPFASLNGNSQGYAFERSIAVNPCAVLPHKTTFHELAHVVLGHTKTERMDDGEELRRDIQEVEAECVAYILCSVLNLQGLIESRGYIQHWMRDGSIQDATAKRIFSAATKILKAGQQSGADHE